MDSLAPKGADHLKQWIEVVKAVGGMTKNNHPQYYKFKETKMGAVMIRL